MERRYLRLAFNSGALWGLICVALLFLVIKIVRKRKSEREVQRYGDGQIYRPEEWEAKQRELAADSAGAGKPIVEPGASKAAEPGSDVRQEDIPPKPSAVSGPDNAGDKKPRKAGKRPSIAIPDIEPIDE